MKKSLFLILVVIAVSCQLSYSQTSVTIYQNNFEIPKVTPTETVAEVYRDLDSRPVDDLYGGTGSGTSAAVYFKQPSNTTVETILIKGTGNTYSDPSGKGGSYSIGMLSAAENDKLAIKLDATRPTGGTFPFINVAFDFSSIALRNKNNSAEFTATIPPVMDMRIYNAPNWDANSAVDFANPGTQIGTTKTVTGGSKTANYTFNWNSVLAGFSLANPPAGYNGKVIIIFDLLPNNNNNFYASFDNIKITADLINLPVDFGAIEATLADENLTVNWETQMEKNNSHFEVQASKDGNNFKTITTVKSKALGGNSDAKIGYTFSTPIGNVGMAALSILGLLMGGTLYRKRRWVGMVVILLSLSAVGFSCSKGDSEPLDVANSKIFIRIIQVDIDGERNYSETVQAIRK